MLVKFVFNILLLILVYNQNTIVSAQNGICKNLHCKPDEYCSPLHGSCYKCSEICRMGHELWSECESGCAAYISEQNKTQQYLEIRDLKENVKNLQSLVKISFILSGVSIFITSFMILIMTYKWCQRKGFSLPKIFDKNSEKKMPSNSIRDPDSTLTDIKIPTISRNGDLQLKVTENSVNGGDTVVDSPTTLTTTISRRGAPSESRGFDYTYDNPAMSTQGTQGSRDTGF